jgi:cyanophycin synthetase
MLAEQGCTLASILPAGREVVLSRIAHTWAGAGYIDCTDEVHPLVAAAVVSAVKLIGLDVAGVDVIAEDISRPLEEQQGAILEVNSEPSIAIHFPPLCESHRPVCEAIIESLFPAPSQGRIPIVCITGSGDLAAAGAEVARLLRESGRSVGQASVTGLYLNDRRLKPGDQAKLAGTRAVLLCPEVEIAIIERTPESVRTEGLGFDACDAALVLAPEAIHDPELQRAIDVVREASEKSYVASELDPLVLGEIAALGETIVTYI